MNKQLTTHTHTHPFNGPLSGTTQVSRYQSDSGISWAICKSALRSRQITTPTPHHSVFTARCYASAVLAMGLCPSVSVTSRCSTKTAKRRITQTTSHDSPGTLVFRCQRSPRNSNGVTPLRGRRMQAGWVKIGDFRHISGYISKMVKDRHVVSISRIGSRMRSIERWHCP